MTSDEQPPSEPPDVSANESATSIANRKKLQRLLQEQVTFDQKKVQDARWSILKLAMGTLATLLIPTIIGICTSIIYDPAQTASVKSLAAGALLVDILGLVAGVWRVILSPASVTQLAPVTEADEDSSLTIEGRPAQAPGRDLKPQEPDQDGANPMNPQE